MATLPPGERFSWNRSAREIWGELSDPDFPTDSPDYQKLIMLPQLKAADANEKSARALTKYILWVMILTIFIALGTFVQGMFTALMFFRASLEGTAGGASLLLRCMRFSGVACSG